MVHRSNHPTIHAMPPSFLRLDFTTHCTAWLTLISSAPWGPQPRRLATRRSRRPFTMDLASSLRGGSGVVEGVSEEVRGRTAATPHPIIPHHHQPHHQSSPVQPSPVQPSPAQPNHTTSPAQPSPAQPTHPPHGLGRRQGLREDLLVHLLHALVVEGREAAHHLVHERAQAPPVDALPVALVLQHLKTRRTKR